MRTIRILLPADQLTQILLIYGTVARRRSDTLSNAARHRIYAERF